MRLERVQKNFTQDPLILLVLRHPLKLATLHDLQTKYNTADLYDMIEIIEADAEYNAIHNPSDK